MKAMSVLVLLFPVLLGAQPIETETSNRDVAEGIAAYLIESEISLTEENRGILENIIEVVLNEADVQADADIKIERAIIKRLEDEIARRKNFGIGAGVTVDPEWKLSFSVSVLFLF
jgi:hypothetical protein